MGKIITISIIIVDDIFIAHANYHGVSLLFYAYALYGKYRVLYVGFECR